jgi:hypothetical protein
VHPQKTAVKIGAPPKSVDPKNPLSKSLTWPKSEFRPQAQAQVKNGCLGQNREMPKKHRKKIGFGS